MNKEFFMIQIERLRIRFGARHFDNEFVALVADVTRGMSEAWFKRTVDVWIGSRTHNKPPLLSEFRESALEELKAKRRNEAHQAAAKLASQEGQPEGLTRHLKLNYPGARSIMEAVDIQRHRNKIEEADNNDNDPKGAA